MTLRNRFVDGVNSLFERLGNEDTLGTIDAVMLEKELALRVAARKAAGNPQPTHGPFANLVGAGDQARARRASLASKRVAKIRKERAASAQSRPHTTSKATNGPQRRPPQSRSTRSSRNSQRPSIFQDKELAAHYKTLNVDYGANAATVKKAYRSLMRQYHPDLFRDARKKKAATKLTVKISKAYEAIDKSRQ